MFMVIRVTVLKEKSGKYSSPLSIKILNFQFWILNFKIIIQPCWVHIYCEKKRGFLTLIFVFEEIKTCGCNWCQKSVI